LKSIKESKGDEHNTSLPVIKNPRDIQMQEELAEASKGNYRINKTPAKIPT